MKPMRALPAPLACASMMMSGCDSALTGSGNDRSSNACQKSTVPDCSPVSTRNGRRAAACPCAAVEPQDVRAHVHAHLHALQHTDRQLRPVSRTHTSATAAAALAACGGWAHAAMRSKRNVYGCVAGSAQGATICLFSCSDAQSLHAGDSADEGEGAYAGHGADVDALGVEREQQPAAVLGHLAQQPPAVFELRARCQAGRRRRRRCGGTGARGGTGPRARWRP
jgi:hypothetical protein